MRLDVPRWSLALWAIVALFSVWQIAPVAKEFLPLAWGQGSISPAARYVKAELLSDSTSVVPGKPFRLGVRLKLDPGWHTYYKESGEAGMPTAITWTLPPGFKAGELQWQRPEKFRDSGITTYGYKDETLVGATVTPPESLAKGGRLFFKAEVKYLACKEMCVPGSAEVSLELPVADLSAQANSKLFSTLGFAGSVKDLQSPATNGKKSIIDQDLQIEGARQRQLPLGMYLALAFVGGFVLNFMPCVLPVISIKVLSFMQQAGEEPKRVFQLGLTFASGIIASFLTLALVVIAAQQAGAKVGWGFQFQYPGFIIGMSALTLLFALSLLGLFYLSFTAGQSQIDQLAMKEGYVGTFFKGVLATTLSTPCTAPFLGTALGFAFAQAWWIVVLVFLTIGVGMSFPYLLLTARPGWMKYIPKPGAWMEKFKEAMAFPLLATLIWLLWVLAKQVGVEGVIWTASFLLVLSFAAWMVGRFTDLTSSPARKYTVWTLALVMVLLGYYFCIYSVPGLGAPLKTGDPAGGAHDLNVGGIDWKSFTLKDLDRELSANKTVFLDFTADWCLTCKVNEQTVIYTPAVIEKMKALNVVAFKADWTRQNPQITRLLQKFGRSGVPLYVIFPGGRPAEPIVLPEVITQAMVLQKLEEAGPSK